MKYKMTKESKRITRQAKHIFGKDIVDSAYFAVDVWDDAYANKQLYDMSDQKNTTICIDEIDIGCMIIVIKFKNGNMVSFNSSEWGYIKKVKEIKMYSPESVTKE